MKRRLLVIGGLIFFSLGLQAQSLRFANSMLLDQQGEGHQLTFAQRGLGHQLDLKQIANMEPPPVGFRNGYHRMRIEQQGYGHSATLHQFGSENAIESYQNGILNTLTIFQGNSVYGSIVAAASTNQVGYNNQLTIEQIVGGSIWHEQIGVENTANYSLEGGMDISVRQLGNSNEFEGGGTYGDQVFSALQRGNGNLTTLGNFLAIGGNGLGNVRQLGDDNVAYGSLERGMLEIQQDGDRNQAHTEIFRGAGEGIINQLGNDNQALISLAELSDMKAEIVQEGSGNSASAIAGQSGGTGSINQNGDKNLAEINLYFDVSNISINQTGDRNQAFINSDNSAATSELVQRGDGNLIDLGSTSIYQYSATNRISQNGNDNIADINGLFDNRGDVMLRQEGSGNKTDLLYYNDTKLEQIGNGNSIVSEQFYGIGIAVYQEGARNFSELLQIEGGSGLKVAQMGNDNHANAYQASSGFTIEASIHQEGNQNSLIGEQYAGEPIFMEVVQSGNNNHSEYEQGYFYNGKGKIIQQGNDNQALLNQTYSFGSENEIVAEIQQEGDGNQASIVQMDNYEAAVVASIHQLGDQNQAVISQTYGEGNQASIRQEGLGNNAEIIQQAAYQQAGVNQLGDNNLALLTQQGESLKLNVLQEGNDNAFSGIQNTASAELMAEQYGERNQASHIQEYESANVISYSLQRGIQNSAAIHQYASSEALAKISQWGANNSANILQEYGYNQEAAIYQWGQNNQGVIRQTADASGSLGEIWQVGNNNEATLEQLYRPTNIQIFQYGNNQKVHVVR